MSTVSLGIRRAGQRDAVGIATVHDEAWRYAYRGIVPPVALERMVERRGAKWWQTAIRRSATVMVLDFDDCVAGYVTLGANRAKRLGFAGEIYELYILPTHQGIGLGRRLFAAAREELRRAGMPNFVVWALEENELACDFYQRMGGRPVALGAETFDGVEKAKIAFGWSTKSGGKA